jgi:hypothetical protein
MSFELDFNCSCHVGCVPLCFFPVRKRTDDLCRLRAYGCRGDLWAELTERPLPLHDVAVVQWVDGEDDGDGDGDVNVHHPPVPDVRAGSAAVPFEHQFDARRWRSALEARYRSQVLACVQH